MDAKESLRQRIHSCLDKMGPYHIFLLSLFGIFSTIAGYSNTVGVFYTFTPEYYCGGVLDESQPLPWNQCESVDSPTNCSFNPSAEYNSIVTDYHLICSDRYLSALSSTLYFAGVTIGALIFGPLSDYMGRRRTLQITTIGHFLMGLCIHFKALTPTIGAFIALRFLQGSFNQGLQTIAYTSLIEYTPVKYRTFMGCLWEVCWALGLIYVGALSMINYEWRTLQLYLLIPTGVGLVFTWILPESLHWQWSKNKFKETIENYTKIAKRNGDKGFIREEEEFQKDRDWQKLESEFKEIEKHNEGRKVGHGLTIIFRNVILRKHIIIMSLFWFTVTLGYYMITFFLPTIAVDRHTNFILGAGVEVVAYFVTWIAMQRYGRPTILGVFMICNSAICIAFAIIVSLDKSSSANVANLLLLAKGLSVSGFCGMYIYTGELFPTISRGTVFGFCGFWSRVGSLIAPQILSWAEVVNPMLPLYLLGALLVIVGPLIFLLPETMKIQIPNTVEDVNKLWVGGERRKLKCCW